MGGCGKKVRSVLCVFLLSVLARAVSLNASYFPREEVTGRAEGEKWGYVEVRPGAHMFWWLYRTTNPKGSTNVPLVLWLQGGPGGSGTGFGNFEEIGPLDTSLHPRNTTWLAETNLLFIDNPVGTGYSYADNDKAYTTDVQQIADDLLSIFKVVMRLNEDLTSVPFYIFSESYGGKMTAAFSQVLHQAVQSGEVKSNFMGLAMGDSWISPVDSVYSWGPYLYVNSLIDRTQLLKLNQTAEKVDQLARSGDWAKSTEEWSALEDQVEASTAGVNFYNIQKWQQEDSRGRERLSSYERAFLRHVGVYQKDDLAELMNGPIREKLGCIPSGVKWGAQSGMVFTKQAADFMKPVTDIVDTLISNTSLTVVVYSGQLDLIVDNLGTEAWVYRLKIADQFSKAKKEVLEIQRVPQAFVKTAKNFQYYYVLAAGHMVPADNGPAALLMLKRIVGV